MALAKGEAVVVVVEGEVALAPEAPGVVPPPGLWVFWASRFAFCSSTLGNKTTNNRQKLRIILQEI
jgi:hypothetical protein